MNIQFPGETAVLEFGLSVRAVVDGKTVACIFTAEVLQDINPNTRMLTPEEQYHANEFQLQNIAEYIIESGRIVNNQIKITKQDLNKI